MEKIKKDCSTCLYKENQKMCKPYCIDFSSHEFECDYCKSLFPEGSKLFCDQDAGDDGMNCCGDKFEFNTDKFEIE